MVPSQPPLANQPSANKNATKPRVVKRAARAISADRAQTSPRGVLASGLLRPVPLPAKGLAGIAADDDGQNGSPEAFAEGCFGQVPSWFISTLVHGLLFIVLAFWLQPVKERSERSLLASTLDESLDEAERLEEIEETAFEAPSLEELLQEPVEIEQSVDDSPAELSLDIAEIGSEVVENLDAAVATSISQRRGLEGRGESARQALVASGGGSLESERAVAVALEWLAAHQNRDGSWNFDHRGGACQGRCANPGRLDQCPTAATGMALLPFLGAGETHRKGKYQSTVQAGLNYLKRRMTVDRSGGRLFEPGSTMYGHGICSIALCEAYGMTSDRRLMRPAQLTLNYIVNTQDPQGGGWRYAPREPGDTSVVGWQLMALKSGHMADLAVPRKAVAGVQHFLDTVQYHAGAAYGYIEADGQPPVRATTAIGLLCRMYLGWERDHSVLERGVERLGKAGYKEGDVYHNYYATQVMHHYGGKSWVQWNEGQDGKNGMRDYYVETQTPDGHEAGSWYIAPPGGYAQLASETGGRLYMTCMCAMTLEVYYRHLPIYQRQTIEGVPE